MTATPRPNAGSSRERGTIGDYRPRTARATQVRHHRNPLYVAFSSVLLGQLLVFHNWIVLVYLVAGIWLIHRQVLREEEFLRKQYGQEYVEYCHRIRRYL